MSCLEVLGVAWSLISLRPKILTLAIARPYLHEEPHRALQANEVAIWPVVGTTPGVGDFAGVGSVLQLKVDPCFVSENMQNFSGGSKLRKDVSSVESSILD